MILGQITVVIMMHCHSLEELQEIEDFVLENMHIYDKVHLDHIYMMLETRNKMLYEDKTVRKKIYRD